MGLVGLVGFVRLNNMGHIGNQELDNLYTILHAVIICTGSRFQSTDEEKNTMVTIVFFECFIDIKLCNSTLN